MFPVVKGGVDPVEVEVDVVVAIVVVVVAVAVAAAVKCEVILIRCALWLLELLLSLPLVLLSVLPRVCYGVGYSPDYLCT